jgi:hypothetical protein
MNAYDELEIASQCAEMLLFERCSESMNVDDAQTPVNMTE